MVSFTLNFDEYCVASRKAAKRTRPKEFVGLSRSGQARIRENWAVQMLQNRLEMDR